MADNTGKRAEANELAENDPFAELTRIMGYDQDAKPVVDPADDLALELEKELMGEVLDVPEHRPEENTGAEVIFWKQPPNIPAQSEPDFEDQFDSAFEPVVNVDEPQVAAYEPHEEVSEPQDHNVFTLHENDLLSNGWPEPVETASAPPEPQGYQEEPELDHFSSAEELPHVGFAEPAQEYEAAPDAGGEDGASLEYFHAPAEPQGYQEDQQSDAFGSSGELPYVGFAEPAQEYETAPDVGGEDGASLEYFQAPAEPQGYQEKPQPDHLGSADELPNADGFAEPAQEHEAAPDVGDEDDGASFDYSRAAAERHEFLTVDDLTASMAELGNFNPEMERAPSEQAPLMKEEAAHEEWQPQQFSPVELSTEWSPAVTDDGYRAHLDSGNDDDLAPAIETVDVPEKAVAVVDSFDIPDVPYKEEKPAAQFDEIEEILAGAFGDMSTPTDQGGDTWVDDGLPETSGPSSLSEEEPQDDRSDGIPGIAAVTGTAAAFDSHAFAGLEQDAGYRHGADAAYRDDWSPEPRHAQLTPEPGIEPPVEASRFRVGPYIRMAGALAVAVAILGGVTYFALNFGDSSSGGEPVLIAADPSPVKERPEEPGGVEIPNQDNQVYRRVSGEQIDNQPEQARLVSGTEEPVDLPPAARTEAAQPAQPAASPEGEAVALAPLPGNSSSNASASGTGGVESLRLGSDTTAEPAKIEDRLPGVASSQTNDSNDVVSLAPRRVRSMVVRPDGTMVPYEAPAPIASASAEANAGSTQAEALQPEAEAGALPSNAMPQTGPIPPSRPANLAAAQPQQTAPAQQPQPQQPAQQQPVQQAAVQPAQTAAAPAPTAQPASSAWSVQIASQPSIEGAQQSYQHMAQRFGNLLQGRGVNIVKAEIDGRGTFYRVRIPSTSKDDAIQLCSQLKSAGGSCFVSQ